MLYYILPTSLLFNVSFSANYSLCGFQGALVGSSGLEPPTSRLSGVRSNLLSYEPSSFSLRPASFQLEFVGGDERVRTDDPLLAKQVLSQLSYTPLCRAAFLRKCFSTFRYALLRAGTSSPRTAPLRSPRGLCLSVFSFT